MLDIFRYAESQLQVATDDDSRRTASAFNGCVLLEAPTGAGKTLMAGLIAEAFARPDHPDNARIVWFWFTPFANLVEQAKGALKQDFSQPFSPPFGKGGLGGILAPSPVLNPPAPLFQRGEVNAYHRTSARY